MRLPRRRTAEGMAALALAAVAVLLLDVIAPQRPLSDPVDDASVVRAPVGGSWVCTAGIGGADAVLRPVFGDVDDPVEVEADADAAVSSLAAEVPEDDTVEDELFAESESDADTDVNTYRPSPRDAAGVELVISRPDAQWDVIGAVEIREFVAGIEVNRTTYDTAASSEIRYTVAGHADPTFVEVTWSGPPVTVSRVWSLPGEPIPATLAGPCQTTSAYGFVAPGFSTADGANARLRIANPYPTSASVAVRFFTPDGVEEPAVLSNVSISPFTVYEVNVNDVLPERDDVAAQIDLLAGRVAVEGTLYAAVTGNATRGMSLLPVVSRERALVDTTPTTDEALGAPRYIHANAVTFDRDGQNSWLWLTNVSDDVARVDLVLHTPDGAVPPEGLAEVSIPPLSVRRIAFANTFPADVTAAGVSGHTDSPAVFMSVGVDLAGDEGPRGFAVTAGQMADSRWVVSGPRSDRRSEQLLITNVSAEDISVDVWFNNGEAVSEPEELQGRLIPAGSSRVVDLDAYLVAGFGYTAFVRAPDAAVVVASFGYTTGATQEHLVVDGGVGSARWLVRTPELDVRHEAGLIRRLSGPYGS